VGGAAGVKNAKKGVHLQLDGLLPGNLAEASHVEGEWFRRVWAKENDLNRNSLVPLLPRSWVIFSTGRECAIKRRVGMCNFMRDRAMDQLWWPPRHPVAGQTALPCESVRAVRIEPLVQEGRKTRWTGDSMRTVPGFGKYRPSGCSCSSAIRRRDAKVWGENWHVFHQDV
jgi:hypothetical protein